jgi:dipeptidyl aminopeptidase/acylaminoacyl peptidase
MRAHPATAAALLLAGTVNAAPPPIAAFIDYAKYETAALSPTGKYLALTRRDAEHEILTVLTLPDLKLAGQTQFGSFMDVERLEWANESRLLIQPTRRYPGFIAYKAPTGEIIGIDADGKKSDLLFGYAAGIQQTGRRIKQRESIDAPARLLARLPNEPDTVLIQTYGYGIKGDFNSVYRMNVNTGLLVKIADSPVRNGEFVLDADRRVAFVFGSDYEGRGKVYFRRKNEWQLVAEENELRGNLAPVGSWGKPGEFLALDDRDASSTGVFSYNPETGTNQLLFRKPEVDAGSPRFDVNGKPWMFVYEDHYQEYWYPDPQHPLAQAHQWLRTTFRGVNIDISSTTDDMNFVLAVASAPRVPRMYFHVDARNKQVLARLAAYPDLKTSDLADVEPFELKARDGTKLRGFITAPNAPVKKKLPLIVMIHGGPHGVYDVHEFDPEAQLFASRGYAVLQLNYRGSGGRGRDFISAGYQEWGRAMQDDVTDAIKWAIKDGVADRSRICIYGASYGAYSALTGAFREPEMFRCAVGMAGVYDLSLMYTKGDIQTVASGVNYLKLALGSDVEELKRRSPVYNAEKIRAPVLLLHGKDDQRAPFEHALRMQTALEKAGHPPEFLSEWGERHGFFDEDNRIKAYERILAFFEKHLAAEGSVAAAQ